VKVNPDGTVDDALRIIRCGPCGVRLLVDPEAPLAILHHLPEGAHRLIPAPSTLGAIAPHTASQDLTIGLLAVAIRLRDLADDCDEVLAHAQGVDR